MYQIKYVDLFQRNIKKLKKKYPNIKDDLTELIEQLEQGNFIGDELQGFKRLKGKIIKVRIPSKDQQRGKRGGFRVVYYIITNNKIVNLIYIYAKTKQENITDNQNEKIQGLVDFLNDL